MRISPLSMGLASLAALVCQAGEEYIVEEVFPDSSTVALDAVLSFCIDDADNFVVVVDSTRKVLHVTPWRKPIKEIPIPGKHVAADRLGNIYVVGSDNGIHKFDPQGRFVMRWGGSGFGQGKFRDPCDIETDGEGDVYVLDEAEGCLESFGPNGEFIREWRGFQRPHGFGIDRSNGLIYVCDTGASSIRKFERGGRPLLEWGKRGAGDGQFERNVDAAAGSDGTVFVIDDGTARLQRFDPEGNFLGRVDIPGLWDAKIAIDSADNAYVSNANQLPGGRPLLSPLLRIALDGQLGGVLGDLLQNPVEARPLGDAVYFLENASRQIRRWDREDGSIRDVIQDPSTIGVIESFALDSTRGFLYVADEPNARILKYDLDGKPLAEWTGEGGDGSKMIAPRALAIDEEGNVLVLDASDRYVRRFDAHGKSLGRFGGSDAIFSPKGIAVDGEDAIYVSDAETDSILKFGADGTLLFSWGMDGTGEGQFRNPWGIATDAWGHVYVADYLNSRMQKFDSSGGFVAQFAERIDGKPVKALGVDVDRSGDVILPDRLNNRLVRLRRRATFVRGDGNGDGSLDLGDPVFLLNFLFASGAAPECLDSADIDDDGRLTIGDPVYLLNHLFAGGGAPSPPYPDPGIDPTADELGCVGD